MINLTIVSILLLIIIAALVISGYFIIQRIKLLEEVTASLNSREFVLSLKVKNLEDTVQQILDAVIKEDESIEVEIDEE